MWHRLISERWLSSARRSRAELASQTADENGLAEVLPGNA
jgi:hypothetical protein